MTRAKCPRGMRQVPLQGGFACLQRGAGLGQLAARIPNDMPSVKAGSDYVQYRDTIRSQTPEAYEAYPEEMPSYMLDEDDEGRAILPVLVRTSSRAVLEPLRVPGPPGELRYQLIDWEQLTTSTAERLLKAFPLVLRDGTQRYCKRDIHPAAGLAVYTLATPDRPCVG